jgi:hypothetical protein
MDRDPGKPLNQALMRQQIELTGLYVRSESYRRKNPALK